MPRKKRPKATRAPRRWQRIPLAIPTFARGHDENGRNFLEFASALNISGGGVLLALRHKPSQNQPLFLEIPAPKAEVEGLPTHVRDLKGHVVYVIGMDGFQLAGVEFTPPVTEPDTQPGRP
jgi:hypothetical protein